MAATRDQAYYDKGFDKTVSKTHAWRTAENCAEYMLPHIKSSDKILDVGCGPGTITVTFGKYVPDGSVVGIEPTQELIDASNELKQQENITNVSFQLGLAYQIPFEDNTFDAIHTHQVLIHLEDPLKAMKEMRRVVKPGGKLFVKEADLGMTTAYPEKFDHTIAAYFKSQALDPESSTKMNQGRSLRHIAINAGFVLKNIHCGVDTWCISNDGDRKEVGEMFRDRVTVGKRPLVKNNPEQDKIKRKEIEDAFDEFIEDGTAWFIIVNPYIIAEK